LDVKGEDSGEEDVFGSSVRGGETNEETARGEVVTRVEIRIGVEREHLPKMTRQAETEEEASVSRRRIRRPIEDNPRRVDPFRRRRDSKTGGDAVVEVRPVASVGRNGPGLDEKGVGREKVDGEVDGRDEPGFGDGNGRLGSGEGENPLADGERERSKRDGSGGQLFCCCDVGIAENRKRIVSIRLERQLRATTI
jgi:hypothetical protein